MTAALLTRRSILGGLAALPLTRPHRGHKPMEATVTIDIAELNNPWTWAIPTDSSTAGFIQFIWTPPTPQRPALVRTVSINMLNTSASPQIMSYDVCLTSNQKAQNPPNRNWVLDSPSSLSAFPANGAGYVIARPVQPYYLPPGQSLALFLYGTPTTTANTYNAPVCGIEWVQPTEQ